MATPAQERQRRRQRKAAIRARFSFLPKPLFDVYFSEWVKAGDPDMALARMREDKRYDQFYPGNTRGDGSLRYDESTYTSIRENMADTLRVLGGVNPKLFQDDITRAIANNKSPDEFASQVETVVTRVIQRGADMQNQYAKWFGTKPTLNALIAGVLKPNLSEQLLAKQITMAEIAVEGAERGFDIKRRFARTLFEQGLDEAAAGELFGQGRTWVPTLNVLAARHADPDDEFDIERFSELTLFQDPDERQLMRRLVAQERAAFAESGTFGIQRDQRTGQLRGLEPV